MNNILFDLDGTLTDPKDGIIRCINYALATLGYPLPDEKALLQYIGPPLNESFSIILNTSDERLIIQAVALYRERFGDLGMYENEVYDGIFELLLQLNQKGFKLYVATSKPRVFARKILDYFDLSQYFGGIYGSELDGTFSEKTDLIRHVTQTEALSPQTTCMIGDRKFDIQGAIANNVTPLGVLWGYGSREELESAGARYLAENPPQVYDLVS